MKYAFSKEGNRQAYPCYILFVWYSVANFCMKKDIHPDTYRMVIFHDNSSGERFLVGSTIETTETDTWTDGATYPLAHIDVSSASHPFYTGNEKIMDSAGRVERFKARAKQATKRGTKKV